jgi:hypothetical protein
MQLPGSTTFPGIDDAGSERDYPAKTGELIKYHGHLKGFRVGPQKGSASVEA